MPVHGIQPVRSRTTRALRHAALAVATLTVTSCSSDHSDQSTGPTESSTAPTTAPPPTTRGSGAPTPTFEHVLTALAPMEVTLTLPTRWESDDGLASTEMGGQPAYIGGWPSGDFETVYADPCQHSGTDEEVGPSVDELAAALERQPTRQATVADVEIDGVVGKRVSMTVPDDIDVTGCDGGQFRSWPGRYHQGPGQRDDVYVLDVDGTRAVITVSYFPTASAADMGELAEIVRSIRIDQAVSLAPATTA